MSDTILQNCKCCETEDDCIDGLCQCCSIYNQKLQKQSDLLTLGILQEKNKYDTLKASHEKLVEVIEAAIRIKDIWTLPTNEACFHNEAVALQTMRTNFEQALKEAEKI